VPDAVFHSGFASGRESFASRTPRPRLMVRVCALLTEDPRLVVRVCALLTEGPRLVVRVCALLTEGPRASASVGSGLCVFVGRQVAAGSRTSRAWQAPEEWSGAAVMPGYRCRLVSGAGTSQGPAGTDRLLVSGVRHLLGVITEQGVRW